MGEMNFCPYCDAPQHKLLACKEDIFFCKACNRFFKFKDIDVRCDRCKGDIKKSDFPSPSGDVIFFCSKCKRTFPAKEILKDIQ